MLPNLEIENKLIGITIGMDEVGRGAIAGPLVAAAVIVDNSALELGINDSKLLTKNKREKLYNEIISRYPYAIAEIAANKIDEINIYQATRLAMRQALKVLNHQYQHVLIDGNMQIYKRPNFHSIIKGDSKSISIAAASIIAKVFRDRLMSKLYLEYPVYKWEKNVGYGTQEHFQAINQFGICKYHRKTFITKHIEYVP